MKNFTTASKTYLKFSVAATRFAHREREKNGIRRSEYAFVAYVFLENRIMSSFIHGIFSIYVVVGVVFFLLFFSREKIDVNKMMQQFRKLCAHFAISLVFWLPTNLCAAEIIQPVTVVVAAFFSATTSKMFFLRVYFFLFFRSLLSSVYFAYLMQKLFLWKIFIACSESLWRK